MKLTLIRHGITVGNLKRLYYGSTDLPLLESSVEELKAFAARGRYPKAERYFTSGMLRAEQTFQAIYGDIPHGILPGLREIDFGIFEMKTYEQLCSVPEYLQWIDGDNEANVCPGGESGVMVTERALAALAPVISDERDTVCVTHGGVIGGVLGSMFPNSGGRYAFTPEPGGGFTVELSRGEPIGVTPLD